MEIWFSVVISNAGVTMMTEIPEIVLVVGPSSIDPDVWTSE